VLKGRLHAKALRQNTKGANNFAALRELNKDQKFVNKKIKHNLLHSSPPVGGAEGQKK
jgi:hypothetical protein